MLPTVKYRCEEWYSITQFSGVVRAIQVVSFNGAVLAVAVPALRWRIAVGVVTPIPTLPVAPMIFIPFGVVDQGAITRFPCPEVPVVKIMDESPVCTREL